MTNMIELTVKTLDSQNHQFNVADEMTVKDFKAEISPRIGIPAEQQRLIFRGRVLQDEKKLKECNVANNTVHVVIRPANASSNRNNDQPSARTNNERGAGEGQGGIIITGDTAGGGGRNAIIMGAIGLPSIDIQVQNSIADAGGANSSGSRTRNNAAFRLQVGNQMLGRASSLLRRLEVDDSIASAAAAAEPGPVEDSNLNQQTENTGDNSPMDIDLDDQNSFGRMISQVANAASAAALVASIRQVPSSGAGNENNGSNNSAAPDQQPADGNTTSNNAANGAATPRRPEAPRLREMAIVIQDVLAFQERLSPYLQFIQSTLRNNRLYETEEVESTQYVFDTVSSILHFMGHSYHALSDIMCDFTTPPETRRLRAAASVLVEQSSVIRATIPIGVPVSMLSGNLPNSTASNTTSTQSPNAPAAGTGVQPEVNLGANGQPPPPTVPTSSINFGSGAHQINFGGLGHPAVSFSGTSQGGFGIPDLSALLGPAMAAGGLGGLMPMFMQANMSQGGGGGRPASTNNSQSSAAGATLPPGTGTNTNTTASGGGTPRQQTGVNNNNLPGNVMGMGMGMNNLPQHLRNELSRPPFDILLSCHSHHGSRTHSNNRPANLRQFVNVGDSSSKRVTQGSSEDFLLHCADLLWQSNLLNILQPVLHDVISNYLMRGRDVKNNDHIRSCGKSLGKKLSPFFESFTEKVSNRNEKVVYSETYSVLITDFFTEILRLTLSRPSGDQYKTEVIRTFEKLVNELMAVFKVCFSRSGNYLQLFVTKVVSTLFGGTSLIFRDNAVKNLTEYLSSVQATGYISSDAKIVYKPEIPDVVQNPRPPMLSTVPQAQSNNSSEIVGSNRVAGVLPPKQARQNPGPSGGGAQSVAQNMDDEDIDDMLNLTSAPRRPRTQISMDSSSSNFDTALRNIPSEWVDTVRHDLHRQLGMPDQPPFSPGYTALLSRKP